jgi:hypothetical protein
VSNTPDSCSIINNPGAPFLFSLNLVTREIAPSANNYKQSPFALITIDLPLIVDQSVDLIKFACMRLDCMLISNKLATEYNCRSSMQPNHTSWTTIAPDSAGKYLTERCLHVRLIGYSVCAVYGSIVNVIALIVCAAVLREQPRNPQWILLTNFFVIPSWFTTSLLSHYQCILSMSASGVTILFAVSSTLICTTGWKDIRPAFCS